MACKYVDFYHFFQWKFTQGQSLTGTMLREADTQNVSRKEPNDIYTEHIVQW